MDDQGLGKKEKQLIVVLGPTAVGKTSVAISLARQFDAHILSFDSRQFYKELHIGTAKPTEEELKAAPHHFIGHISVQEYYNASMFEVAALEKIAHLHQSSSHVIAVGGSGMYVDTLCHGIDDIPDADEQVRAQVTQLYEEKGIDELRAILKRVDPVFYQAADLHNYKRLLRGVEVYLQTGKPFSSFRQNNKKERPFNILKIGIHRDREELYQRINQRVEDMVHQGLVEEARSVYPLKHLNGLNTVGYKELFAYFDGAISLEQAIEQIKVNTRRYAKRQLTWFRRDASVHWFYPDQLEEMNALIRLG